jgi:hypothetical protein
MDSENIQTKHIVNVVGAFMSAAIPWNIVKSFELPRFYLIKDDETLRIQVRPNRTGRLLHLIRIHIPDMDDTDDDSDADDDIEEKLFVEECAELLFDIVE